MYCAGNSSGLQVAQYDATVEAFPRSGVA